MLYIHQIWFQGEDKIPSKYYENIKTIKTEIPSCIYKCWDDTSITQLLSQKSPELLEKYKGYVYMHQKIDFARYCILYFIGGLYVDMDAYVVKSPEYLKEMYPEAEVFVSTVDTYMFESLATTMLPQIINNGIIYAPKVHSEFMKNCITQMPSKSYSFFPKFFAIQNTTGPRQFTLICKKSSGVIVLAPEFLEPCIKSVCKITGNTIVVHKHEGSWVDPNLNVLLKLYSDNREYLIIPIVLIIIFAIYTSLRK
jgi:mannosyltransferase OCH1-like enzyme